MKAFGFHANRCNFPDISYLTETQNNNFQFLNQAVSNDVQGP